MVYRLAGSLLPLLRLLLLCFHIDSTKAPRSPWMWAQQPSQWIRVQTNDERNRPAFGCTWDDCCASPEMHAPPSPIEPREYILSLVCLLFRPARVIALPGTRSVKSAQLRTLRLATRPCCFLLRQSGCYIRLAAESSSIVTDDRPARGELLEVGLGSGASDSWNESSTAKKTPNVHCPAGGAAGAATGTTSRPTPATTAPRILRLWETHECSDACAEGEWKHSG